MDTDGQTGGQQAVGWYRHAGLDRRPSAGATAALQRHLPAAVAGRTTAVAGGRLLRVVGGHADALGLSFPTCATESYAGLLKPCTTHCVVAYRTHAAM